MEETASEEILEECGYAVPPDRLALRSKLSKASVSFQAAVESSPSSLAFASTSKVFRRAVKTAPKNLSGICT